MYPNMIKKIILKQLVFIPNLVFPFNKSLTKFFLYTYFAHKTTIVSKVRGPVCNMYFLCNALRILDFILKNDKDTQIYIV